MEEQARHMYRLLKPGGELIFWEHCRNTDAVTRAVQCEWFPCRCLSSEDYCMTDLERCLPGLWCLLWPTVIGGCRLDRVTKEALVGAGPWERVEIKTEMQPQDLMPRISGRLIKPAAA